MLWSKDALGLSLDVEKGLGLEIQAGGWNIGSVPFQLVTCLVEEATEQPSAQGGRARLALHGVVLPAGTHAPSLLLLSAVSSRGPPTSSSIHHNPTRAVRCLASLPDPAHEVSSFPPRSWFVGERD